MRERNGNGAVSLRVYKNSYVIKLVHFSFFTTDWFSYIGKGKGRHACYGDVFMRSSATDALYNLRSTADCREHDGILQPQRVYETI